jgi:hypothetical protein
MYLLPLTRGQVLELIEKRRNDLWATGKVTPEEVVKRIESTYNLADLAERPVLLDMILKTIPALPRELDKLNAYKLYSIYTEFWINREEKKGRTLIG